ncbi:MAG: hypothetical protein ACYS0H_20095 [Planctomycetota bacterium]|jgi:hypothetical protein
MLKPDTLKDYVNPVFVETGTYKGEGVQYALDAGFEKIYSIEISESLHTESRQRFIDNLDVVVLWGDTRETLWPIIEPITDRITFFLDSHNLTWADDTEDLKDRLDEYPLMRELSILAKHPRKDHTIIIDDMRLLHKSGQDIDNVKAALLEINPDYTIELIEGLVEYAETQAEEILVAQLGGRT